MTSSIGVTHEGKAEGKYLLPSPTVLPSHLDTIGTFETIGGVNCYVAVPKIDYPKDKAILFLTDIFGIQLINAQASAHTSRRSLSRLTLWL
jgi:hypothetical protein